MKNRLLLEAILVAALALVNAAVSAAQCSPTCGCGSGCSTGGCGCGSCGQPRFMAGQIHHAPTYYRPLPHTSHHARQPWPYPAYVNTLPQHNGNHHFNAPLYPTHYYPR